jgi:hypothetical protein
MKNKNKPNKKKEESNEKEDENDKSKLSIESQNLASTITKKNIEISYLKKKLKENMQYISTMQSELFTLKKFYSDSSKVKRELDDANEKNHLLEKEVESLNQKILDQHKEFADSKRMEEKKHMNEISKLKVTIDSYIQKNIRSNMNELDNEKLYLQLNELKKENKDIIDRTKQQIIQKEIENKIKFTKLKDKMLENINETKDEVTELNMKYMDISTKLTLLQNHQLLVQLDYQTQQLEESTKKNEIYKKKISDLTKDIQLHKEVEISFAEKNKKLIRELMKYRKEENKDNNSKEINISDENAPKLNKSMADASFNNHPQSQNLSILTNSNLNLNNSNTNKINNDYSRILSLEKKVLNLEKKLEMKKKEYNDLKDKNEHIENMLKNKDRKYSGLYNFLEESLNNFFSDEYIMNNKDIYINNEALKHFDFSQLSKEQKYSTLIVLMKYLIPLITNEKEALKPNNNIIEKYKVQYHPPKENTLIINDKFRKFLNIKQRNKNSGISSDNIHKTNFQMSKNASESLPSISRGPTYRKNNFSFSSIPSGKINQSANQ